MNQTYAPLHNHYEGDYEDTFDRDLIESCEICFAIAQDKASLGDLCKDHPGSYYEPKTDTKPAYCERCEIEKGETVCDSKIMQIKVRAIKRLLEEVERLKLLKDTHEIEGKLYFIKQIMTHFYRDAHLINSGPLEWHNPKCDSLREDGV